MQLSAKFEALLQAAVSSSEDGILHSKSEVLTAVSDARQAADWYSQMADASHDLYDKVGQRVHDDLLAGHPHPCSVNPVAKAAQDLHCQSDADINMSDM